MKKGRHRRYEEARALKHSTVGSLEALIKEHDQQNDPEMLAKWPEYAAEEGDTIVNLDETEEDEADDEKS